MTHKPIIKVYNSYGNEGNILVMGHVFAPSPKKKKDSKEGIRNNVLSLLELFRKKPISNAIVKLICQEEEYLVHSEADGFFRFEIVTQKETPKGWKPISVSVLDDLGNVLATDFGVIYFPPVSPYIFVSDIDDTIMKSYSANIMKRLLEMVSKSPAKRRLFDNTSKLYNALAESNAIDGNHNPFFYVSSSEWNLYDYLSFIFLQHQMPKGVFLLNTFRTLSSFINTGRKGHHGKFFRIDRLLKVFTQPKFVLIGDNSQKDSEIYAAIVEKYPDRVAHVLIRNVHPAHQNITQAFLKNIAHHQVGTCLFNTTQEAIHYARANGLIHDRD